MMKRIKRVGSLDVGIAKMIVIHVLITNTMKIQVPQHVCIVLLAKNHILTRQGVLIVNQEITRMMTLIDCVHLVLQTQFARTELVVNVTNVH